MLRLIVFHILFICLNRALGNTDTIPSPYYDIAFQKLNTLIQDNGSFKEAVYTVENAYFKNQLDKEKFYNTITALKNLCLVWSLYNPAKDYKFTDSVNFQKNFSLYAIMKDTVKILHNNYKYYCVPFTYDFNDFTGSMNWTNMFVSKLLVTRKGNCHSLPYLYKILADEIGASCWLSLAPNHIYIKNRCKKTGWYNTELTSGDFPVDSWITASGYIPLKAVQNGIYMDTLSNQQAIVLCVLDLAKGYEVQTKNYYDGFIIKCCDLVLQYHPVNVQALLLKAETLKRIYEKQMTYKEEDLNSTYLKMEQLYVQLFTLGYREMPEKMYLQWLLSIKKQRNKFSNIQLKQSIQKKKSIE